MIDKIKALLKENHLKEALDLLMDLVEKQQNRESYNTLIILQSRLSNVKTSQLRGIISFEDAQLNLNQIREGISELISELSHTNKKSLEIEKAHVRSMANLLNRLQDIETKINQTSIQPSKDQLTEIELERQDFVKNYIEEETRSFEEKAKFVSLDKGIEEKVSKILIELKIYVGGKSSFGQLHKIPIKEDENSPKIFGNIRRLEKQGQVKDILTQIVGDETSPMEKSWKALVLLTYYKSEEALSQVKNLIVRESESRNLNKFVHLDCIEYLDSITKLAFKDRIISTYSFAIRNCPTPEARVEGIKSLVKKSQFGSKIVPSLLVKVTYEDEDDKVRSQAVSGLQKFDISENLEDLNFWLSDGSQLVRNEAISLAYKNPTLISLDDIKGLFEVESNYQNREKFVELMLKIDQSNTVRYAFEILDAGFDDQISSILEIFGRYRVPDLKSRVEQMINNGDESYKAKDYLKKFP